RAEVMFAAIERVLADRPAELPLPAALTVAEAPLRLELVAPPAPGLAVVSDRMLRVHRLLKEFHERELAAALYGAILAETVEGRETAADAGWVLEGVAAE